MELAWGAPVGFLGLVCSYQQAMAIRHKDLAVDAPRHGMLRGEGPGAGQCLSCLATPWPPEGLNPPPNHEGHHENCPLLAFLIKNSSPGINEEAIRALPNGLDIPAWMRPQVGVSQTMNSLLPRRTRGWVAVQSASGFLLRPPPGPPSEGSLVFGGEVFTLFSFCLPFSGLKVPRVVNCGRSSG